MMNRRELLAAISASAFLAVVSPTHVQARDGLRGGNMAEFVKRQRAKQMEKRKEKEDTEKDKADRKKEQKSDD